MPSNTLNTHRINLLKNKMPGIVGPQVLLKTNFQSTIFLYNNIEIMIMKEQAPPHEKAPGLALL